MTINLLTCAEDLLVDTQADIENAVKQREVLVEILNQETTTNPGSEVNDFIQAEINLQDGAIGFLQGRVERLNQGLAYLSERA